MKNANKVNVNNLCENNSQINKVSKCLLLLVAVIAPSFGLQAFGEKITEVEKKYIADNYDNSWPPLLTACYRNHIEDVKLLLNNCDEKSVNIASSFKKTPLYWACYHNNPKMVRLLLPYCTKESINQADTIDLSIDKTNSKTNGEKNGKTALYWACDYNNTELVRLLLDNGAKESVNIVDNKGKTPLYLACKNNNLEIVRLLLENGAKESINIVYKKRETPLYLACIKKNLELVRLLLDNGAKEFVDIVNNDYTTTPLYLAIGNNNVELVRLLLENCDKDCINKINTINKDGDFLLHEACSSNYLDIVRLLLRWGAKESINKVNNNGETPLYLACLRNNLKMVKLLVKRGAKVDKEALDKAEKNYENQQTQLVAIEILKELNPTKEYIFNFSNDKVERKRSRFELEKNGNDSGSYSVFDLKRSKTE